MQNRDWIKTGEEILHSVMDAVEQQDFSGLSKNIENKVNIALESLKKSGSSYSNLTQEWMKVKSERDREAAERAKVEEERINKEKQLLQLYPKNPPGTYAGTTFQVLGIIGTSMFGIAAFKVLIEGLIGGTIGLWLADVIVKGLMAAGSTVMLNCGLKLKRKVARFRNYVKQVGEKQYCKIEELANTVGKKKRFVEKEIRQMIEKGYFLQGHIDHTGTTLITSDAVYDHYLAAEKSRKERELEAARQARIVEQNQGYSEEVQQILNEGNQYIQHIHECNDAIPGEVMSQKLATLEEIMIRIFEQLKRSP